jgi:hypothetical protein
VGIDALILFTDAQIGCQMFGRKTIPRCFQPFVLEIDVHLVLLDLQCIVGVIEVETVELLPGGRDDLFCVFILQTLRARMTSSISEV